MKKATTKLNWHSYQITELDKYADCHFDNGISIRISTGKMAHTTKAFPYEVSIAHPVKGYSTIHKVNERRLNVILNSAENEQIQSISELQVRIKYLEENSKKTLEYFEELNRCNRLLTKYKNKNETQNN